MPSMQAHHHPYPASHPAAAAHAHLPLPLPLLATLAAAALLAWFYAATPPGQWLLGADSKDRTNATWWIRGEPPQPGGKRHRRFWHRPQIQRAGIRHAEALGPALLLAGWWLARTAITWIALAALITLAATAAAIITAWARRAPVHYKWIRPAHYALHKEAGHAARHQPHKWITRDKNGQLARLRLAPGAAITKAKQPERDAYAAAAAAILGINDPIHTWHLAGRTPELLIRGHDPLPHEATWPDWAPTAATLPPGELLVGPGRDHQPITLDQTALAAHAAYACITRFGKTTWARLITAQHLNRGGIALICDPQASHPWAIGLPNVIYATTPRDLHSAWCWADHEVDTRGRRPQDTNGNYLGHQPPRLLVVGEELPLTAAYLAAYWQRLTGKRQPGRSPALDGMTATLHAGAKHWMNMLAVANALHAEFTGGKGAYENLGTRFMCNPSRQAEAALARGHKIERTSVKGRAWVIDGDTPAPVQGITIGHAQARALALSGQVTPFTNGPRLVDQPLPQPPADTRWQPHAATATATPPAAENKERSSSHLWGEAGVVRELGAGAVRLEVGASAAVLPVPLSELARVLGRNPREVRADAERGKLAFASCGRSVSGARLVDLAAAADWYSRKPVRVRNRGDVA